MIRWLTLLLFAWTAGAATLPPEDRRTPWEGRVGVYGGIPNTFLLTTYTNLYPSGGDDGNQIRAALLNCPSNQVVRCIGTFTVGGNIDYSLIGNGKIWTGVGINKTRILLTNGMIFMRPVESFSEGGLSNNFVNLSVDAIKGTNVLTVASVPAWLVVGGTYFLDCKNDTNLVYAYGTAENEFPAGSFRDNFGGTTNRGLCQIIWVTNIVGNNLHIEGLTSYNYSLSQTAQVAYCARTYPLQRCGIEHMTIEATYYFSGLDNIRMEQCANCWVKNVVSTNIPAQRHVMQMYSYRCEVRDSYMDNSHGYAAGQAYGVAAYYGTTACLTENNIFRQCHGAMSMDYGANGNAWAYNFELDGRADSRQSPAINAHGVHTYMNLFEGNYCNDKILLDWSHGSASHLTFLRNRVTGYQPPQFFQQVPVVIDFYSKHMNFLGNIWGVSGFHTNYIWSAPAGPCLAESRDIYRTGYFINWGCGFAGDVYDDITETDLFLAANWDAVTSTNNGIVLGGYTTNDVPQSLLYSSAPSWWPTGKLWPPYDPTMGNSASFTNIPAGYRWLQMTNAGAVVVPILNSTKLIVQ